MIDPLIILLALACGVAVRKLGYPPMLGYLVAGFAIYTLPIEAGEMIDILAEAGVTLLLFTIGLKLNIKELAAPQVWGVASVHSILSIILLGAALFMALAIFPSIAPMEPEAVWIIAFALSFSSTVFAVKIFEDRGESAALHAKLAIGILIMQDLAAVVFLALNTGKLPTFSLALVLVAIVLVLSRPLLYRIMQWSGHGELLLLFGIGAAFGGAALFEVFNIKGDLGALVIGALLANGSKSSELAKSLLDLKDLFLVGFFVSIGLNGLPDAQGLLIALALGVLVFIKPVLYFLLMTALRLRARTAMLASLALFNFSEFGLIVADLAADAGLLERDWVVTIALALSISFFISVPFNTRSLEIYRRYQPQLRRFERQKRLREEEPEDMSGSSIIILGMGRVGVGAYQYLTQAYGDTVVGVEENTSKLAELRRKGMKVAYGDASDLDFWSEVKLSQIQLIMVNLTKHSENKAVCEMIQELGYQGQLAAIARHHDQLKELKAMGCITFNLYGEAGFGFAEHVHQTIDRKKQGFSPGDFT
jgi:predicted Kef-type K+ transport protein